MYRCDQCKHITRPGYPIIRKIVETRPVTYPFRKGAQRRDGLCAFTVGEREDRQKFCKDDHGGSGSQIVKEIAICRRCHEEDLMEVQRQKMSN